MNILHIASITNDRSEGPNINVPKNVLYGNRIANVGLYNLRDSELAVDIPREKFFSIKKYQSVNKLPSPFNKPDIVVFQGIYFIKYCKIAKWFRKNGVPYIIVPRCSMTTAAVRHHFLKKKTATILFLNRFIAGASAIQFLTKNEYLESKDNFKFKDYYILGNGIELPKKQYIIKNRKEFKIVFIGRYNIYHKGLDVLLEVVKKHVDWFRKNSVTIELFGRSSHDGLLFLTKYIRENCIEDVVHVNNPVFDKDKEKAILDADIFIHTSRLEGQPTSVMEAISYGVPVIVTPGTNVSDIVKKHNLGFSSRFDSEAIFDCIRKALNNKKEFLNVSKNEVSYAKNNFDWEMIVKKSLYEYTRILGDSK